jgi:hypothetical protein
MLRSDKLTPAELADELLAQVTADSGRPGRSGPP